MISNVKWTKVINAAHAEFSTTRFDILNFFGGGFLSKAYFTFMLACSENERNEKKRSAIFYCLLGGACCDFRNWFSTEYLLQRVQENALQMS